MPKRRRTQRRKRKTKKLEVPELEALQQINLNAAGLDIGDDEIYVAVPEGRDEVSVRVFQTFTLWLAGCKPAVWTPWPWSLPVSIGFQYTKFWKSAALKSTWSTPGTSGMYRERKPTFWTASGSSNCIRMGYSMLLFADQKISVPCGRWYDMATT